MMFSSLLASNFLAAVLAKHVWPNTARLRELNITAVTAQHPLRLNIAETQTALVEHCADAPRVLMWSQKASVAVGCG